jgi:hypothetical protein
MIDERTLRLSTNPQVIATLILIDEIRQLKTILSNDSSLVFLDTKVDEVSNVSDNTKTTATEQPKKPRGRKKVNK